MATKIKKMGCLFSLRIEDDGMGTISTNGGVYVTDPITAFILLELNKDKDINNIVFELLKKYDISYSVLLKDLDNVIERLYKLKFFSKDYFNKIMKELHEEDN